MKKSTSKKFLSTPSARRATRSTSSDSHSRCNFYPRPPRGGRPRSGGRAGRADAFLSTPSARRATAGHPAQASIRSISIHALREEGDRKRGKPFRKHSRFLSTPSARRATRLQSHVPENSSYFYPRPPRGGRLDAKNDWEKIPAISIHALREEGDRVRRQTSRYCTAYFYPRPPRGGRLHGYLLLLRA